MTTVVIVSHADLASSRAHRKLLGAIAGLRDVDVRHLEAMYPDGRIDVAAEQAAVLPATRIVFQFPFNWYSTPPLLKPLEATAHFVGMTLAPPLVLYNVPGIPVPEDVDLRIDAFCLTYRGLPATPVAAVAVASP